MYHFFSIFGIFKATFICFVYVLRERCRQRCVDSVTVCPRSLPRRSPVNHTNTHSGDRQRGRRCVTGTVTGKQSLCCTSSPYRWQKVSFVVIISRAKRSYCDRLGNYASCDSSRLDVTVEIHFFLKIQFSFLKGLQLTQLCLQPAHTPNV